MLGAAEADALGAELARLGGILGRIGIRAHAQPAQLVGPVEDRAEVLVDRRRHEPDGADDDPAGAAVDRDHVAHVEHVLADRHRPRLRVDREPFAAGDARLAHASRDDRRVRGHATVGRQHAARLDQPVDVVGRRLPADEDDVVARLAALRRRVGVEHDLAGRRTRRGVQALRRDLDDGGGSIIGWSSWSSWPGSIRATASSREISALPRHLDRDAERRRRGALAGAGLEQIEPALLDRELDVLHVAVVGLEPVEGRDQLGVGLGQQPLHLRDRLGRAHARDDVLALRVDEELAVQHRLAGRGVAREADAGARALALVAEHHLDDVDGGADVVGNLVGAPVHLRARRVPRVEHGAIGAAQLLAWILREARADFLLVDLLEGRDQLAQVVGARARGRSPRHAGP